MRTISSPSTCSIGRRGLVLLLLLLGALVGFPSGQAHATPIGGGTLRGVVTSGTVGISGVSVSVPGTSAVSTGADGAYSVAGIIPGTYDVTFSRAGFVTTQTTSVLIEAAKDTQHDVVLIRANQLWRFKGKNSPKAAFLFTDDLAMRNAYIQNPSPLWVYEGADGSFRSPSGTIDGGGQNQVWRFKRKTLDSYFYTASVGEKNLIQNDPNYLYDGLAFRVYGVEAHDDATATVPVHRFYNKPFGTHLYTSSENEKQAILRTSAKILDYDGPAWYMDPTGEPDRTVVLPVARDDSASTISGPAASLTVRAPGVLSNDGPGSDYVYLESGPANGTVSLAGDGGYTYKPNAGFSGADTFRYRAFDGRMSSEPAVVTITVNSPKPVYRFRSLTTFGTYLWTADIQERDNIRNALSRTWYYEDAAYTINTANPLNSDTIWRFKSKTLWTYFYTADPAEKDRIKNDSKSPWAYEGPVGWKVNWAENKTGKPVWRFKCLKNPTYLWTEDAAEMVTIRDSLRSDYFLEGVAYYHAE